MENFVLNVPAATLHVESRGVSVPVNVAEIPHDVLRQVILHGIKQKVADAASSATGLVWAEVKGKEAPKPSKDQLADFTEAHKAAIETQTLAMMQKAVDALLAGQWQVRVAGDGTVSKWTDEQTIALDIARGVLAERFTAALAKTSPGVKPTAANFVTLGEKVAQFFKSNEKRPTWNDSALMEFIKRQATSEGGRDFMAEAREELARREAAASAMPLDLDDLLGDI
jgi:hypothetical protein